MKKVYFIIFLLVTFLFNLSVFSYNDDLESVKEDYFKNYRFDEFVVYLKDLKKKRKFPEASLSYYIALSRYRQLKYLEEKQDWDNYFKYGNNYREELVKEAKKAIDSTSYRDKINLYAQTILWQFYKDQHDPLEAEARKNLIEDSILYAKEATYLEPLREIAETFLIYEHKLEAEKLFRLYAERFIQLETDLDKLEMQASLALKDNNFVLASMLYDAYIERLSRHYPKEKISEKLFSIAKDFYSKDSDVPVHDYIETIFKKIESISDSNILDEEMLYLRIENLERSLNYSEVLKYYLEFRERFKESKRIDMITFKTAVVYAYSSADLEKAKQYFLKLVDKGRESIYFASALYQLGLISQWQNDYSLAVDYYRRLIEEADDEFKDLKELSKKRLKEVEEKIPIEYNLKTFLDLSFAKEKIGISKLYLSASEMDTVRDKPVEISALVGLPESGCLQIEVSYLWSGELGSYTPSIQDRSFATAYDCKGTKLVNLVAVTSQGILDYSYLMLDIE